MGATFTFPDEIAKKVCRLPDKDAFVTRAVADALAQEAEPASEAGLSRWAALAEQIKRDAQSLGEDREVFDRDRKEFRESFRFRHDGRAAAIDALLQLRREQTPLSDEEISRAREADRP